MRPIDSSRPQSDPPRRGAEALTDTSGDLARYQAAEARLKSAEAAFHNAQTELIRAKRAHSEAARIYARKWYDEAKEPRCEART